MLNEKHETIASAPAYPRVDATGATGTDATETRPPPLPPTRARLRSAAMYPPIEMLGEGRAKPYAPPAGCGGCKGARGNACACGGKCDGCSHKQSGQCGGCSSGAQPLHLARGPSGLPVGCAGCAGARGGACACGGRCDECSQKQNGQCGGCSSGTQPLNLARGHSGLPVGCAGCAGARGGACACGGTCDGCSEKSSGKCSGCSSGQPDGFAGRVPIAGFWGPGPGLLDEPNRGGRGVELSRCLRQRVGGLKGA